MNTLKKIVLLACVSAIFVTCKKETLAPGAVEGQPVFSFSGNINGNAINWQAGVNNYYMYSSFSLDSVPGNKGVYNFIGTLQNTATSRNSIQIILDDDTIVARSAPSDINKSITPSYYYYSTPNGTSIWDSVVFTPKVFGSNPGSLTYNFGDGNSFATANASPISHTYKKIQNYTISLTTNFSSGNPRTIKLSDGLSLYQIKMTPLTIDSITYQITIDSAYDHTLQFTPYAHGGILPYSYVWSFAGTTTSTALPTISHTYNALADTTTVTLGIKDTANDMATYSYLIYDSIAAKNRVAYATSSPGQVPNPYSLSTVTINYIDGNGNKYTSNNLSQSPLSTFQVVSVSNYQNNMNNNPTKMLKITFSCSLFNGSQSIPASGTAIIAVAYQ